MVLSHLYVVCNFPMQSERVATIFFMQKRTTSITGTSKWARWRLKSSVSWLFTQAFVRAQIKEHIIALRHWSLCGEFTGDRWIPRTEDQ